MIRKDPLFVVDKYHTHSNRVMSVHMRVDSLHVRLVCAHAPIAEAPVQDHEDFAQAMEKALSCIEAGEVVLTGCDLNARLSTLIGEFQCIGPHATSVCPVDAVFRRSCLALFDNARLVAANTVLQDSQSTTWRHPSGSEHQIDFILVPHSLVECGRLVSAQTCGRDSYAHIHSSQREKEEGSLSCQVSGQSAPSRLPARSSPYTSSMGWSPTCVCLRAECHGNDCRGAKRDRPQEVPAKKAMDHSNHLGHHDGAQQMA
eukprot:565442-Amphidinium_carterae.1